MLFNNDESVEYFDSYGLHPIVHCLEDSIDSHLSLWIYSTKTFKSLISHVCGHYTMYYDLFRSRGCSIAEIVCHFSSNVVLNDKSMERFVNDFLK